MLRKRKTGLPIDLDDDVISEHTYGSWYRALSMVRANWLKMSQYRSFDAEIAAKIIRMLDLKC